MTEQLVEELIRKYADGLATDEEVSQLMDWYRSSRIKEVQWPGSVASEKELVFQRMLTRLKSEMSPPASKVVRFHWLRIAAILFFIAGVAAVLMYLLKPAAPTYITVTNPSGKIQQVTLPDSSAVWLNASTVLRYPSSFKNTRRVELEGEAYFEVTHDQNNPFTVNAGGIETTVLGTAFNIRAFRSAGKTTISVINGKVKVSEDQKELAVLVPSEQLMFERQRKIASKSVVDTGNVLAWRKGKLQFDGESFNEIATILENWYNIKIIFSDPAIAKCRYYISVDNTISIDNFFALMSEMTKLTYVFTQNRSSVTISGDGCQ